MNLQSRQRRMVGHGAWILFVAMIAGIGLLVSLVGGVQWWPGRTVPIELPGTSAAWARTHVGGLSNALLVMVVALLLPVLEFTEVQARRVGNWIVGTGWGNTLFYWAALWAPNRALTLGDNRFGASNLASVLGFVPALLFVLLSMAAVALIGCRAWKR